MKRRSPASKRALEIEPDNLASLRGLAGAFGKLARHDEAIACFERAVATRPDDPRAHVGLGDVMRARARNVDAVAHYERALSLRAGQR